MWKTCKVLIILFILVLGYSTLFSNDTTPKETRPLVPKDLPKGFTFERAPEFYGIYEKELANGTIFTYMNGGGEIYIAHGFKELTHIQLKDSSENTITLNVFNIGNHKNAIEAFADEAICPEGFKEINIGVSAKTYRFEPDFFLYFIKGQYLVYLAVNNDTLSDDLLKFAGNYLKSIQ